MPRRAEPSSYEQRLEDAVADAIIESGDRLAAEHGAPADMQAPSERVKIRLWGRSDPKADRATIAQMLLTTGVPPEQMAQMQISRYGKSHPELLQAYSQPIQDPALADRLAQIAAYPFRLSLYDHLDPNDRVTEADRLDRLWQREQGGLMDVESETVVGG